MRFDAVTLFPEMFDAVLDYGITRRALDRGLYRFKAWNPRDFTDDPHRTVDDRPYGGGPGMLMLAEPLDRTLNAVQRDLASENLTPWVVHFSPRGRPLTQQRVMELKDATLNQNRALVLLCGRYEGIDERLLQRRVDEEISLGDFVLSGGELPALALMDALIRQLPGALNDAESAVQDSFSHGLARLPALHPARSVAGHGGAGRVEKRQPCCDCQVAARRKPAAHCRAQRPTCWHRRRQQRN